MRELLKEENLFPRDEEVQGGSFERIKQLISESPVLKYFDPKADTELQMHLTKDLVRASRKAVSQ